MKAKRDRLNVIYDILNIIRRHGGSIKPTPLLRQSNLSSQNYVKYLKELKEKDFVEESENKKGRKEIRLKEKGVEYLEKYKYIIELINEFNL